MWTPDRYIVALKAPKTVPVARSPTPYEMASFSLIYKILREFPYLTIQRNDGTERFG